MRHLVLVGLTVMVAVVNVSPISAQVVQPLVLAQHHREQQVTVTPGQNSFVVIPRSNVPVFVQIHVPTVSANNFSIPALITSFSVAVPAGGSSTAEFRLMTVPTIPAQRVVAQCTDAAAIGGAEGQTYFVSSAPNGVDQACNDPAPNQGLVDAFVVGLVNASLGNEGRLILAVPKPTVLGVPVPVLITMWY